MRFYFFIISAFLLGSTSLIAQQADPAQTPQTTPSVAIEQSAAHHGDIAVSRLVLATGVSNHEPQGAKNNFSVHDGRVFAFVELVSHGHNHVTFYWQHDGKTYYEFKAPIRDSNRWRTFSSVRALAGSWSVAVQDEQGHVLKEISFNVSHDEVLNTTAPTQPTDNQDKAETKEIDASHDEVLNTTDPTQPTDNQDKAKTKEIDASHDEVLNTTDPTQPTDNQDKAETKEIDASHDEVLNTTDPTQPADNQDKAETKEIDDITNKF